MKFKNVDTGTIVEVPIEDKGRIERFRGYPDKFVEIGELLSNKNEKKANKEAEVQEKEIDDKNEKKKN